MPPKKHAILSASSSHRWLNCNPSARLEQEFEDRTSEAAEEGTAAHALAEHKLRKSLKMRSTRPVSKYDSDEMEAYTDGYVEFVLEALEEAKQQCSDPLVMIEQRLDFSCYVPDGFGTGDCLIVADHILHIIDFKYGMGVLVDAEDTYTYRLQRTTTPEELEMKMMHNGGAILTFGDRILIAGYYYNPNGRCYYGATYSFTTDDHTIEGKIKLNSISDETFIDNGHAIAWAMGR